MAHRTVDRKDEEVRREMGTVDEERERQTFAASTATPKYLVDLSYARYERLCPSTVVRRLCWLEQRRRFSIEGLLEPSGDMKHSCQRTTANAAADRAPTHCIAKWI